MKKVGKYQIKGVIGLRKSKKDKHFNRTKGKKMICKIPQRTLKESQTPPKTWR